MNKFYSLGLMIFFISPLAYSLPVLNAGNESVRTLPAQALHRGPFANEALITARRVRIQRIVLGIDRVGDVAIQMKPEQSDRLEPMLEDLEDRAVGLSDRREIQNASVDDELSDIEHTLQKLTGVVSRMIEPEMSL